MISENALRTLRRLQQINEVYGYNKSPGYRYPGGVPNQEQIKDPEAQKLAKFVHRTLKSSKMGRAAPSVVRDVLEKNHKSFTRDNLHRDKKVEHVLHAMKKLGWKETVKRHKGRKIRVIENQPLWKRLNKKKPK